MNMKERFLAEIAENPNDPDSRRVYADWLEEQGDDRNAAMWRSRAKALEESSCPVIEKIKKIGIGLHKCPMGGWLKVEQDEDGNGLCEPTEAQTKNKYLIWWTSHETSHMPLTVNGEPAVCCEFSPNKVGTVYATALSLHLVRDEVKCKEISSRLVQRINATVQSLTAATPKPAEPAEQPAEPAEQPDVLRCAMIVGSGFFYFGLLVMAVLCLISFFT